MIAEIISLVLACGVWIFGIISIIIILIESNRFTLKDDISLCFFVLCFCGIIGFMLGIPSFEYIARDTKTAYVEPTSIIRTNNATCVVYVGGTTLTKFYTDVKHWTSTNIKVKVTSGNNIWGKKVGDEYDIGIYSETAYEK